MNQETIEDGGMMSRTNGRWAVGMVIVIVVAYMIMILIPDQNEYKSLAKDQSELFASIKQEIEHLAKDWKSEGATSDAFLYINGGNASIDKFHDDMTADLKDKIQQLVTLSDDKLTFVRYTKLAEHHIIGFIFDWEQAYGDTYHIVYSVNRDAVVEDYEGTSYRIEELHDGWYVITFR